MSESMDYMEDYLDNLYNNLYRRLSYETKVQLIYTIIEIKQNYPLLKDRKQSLYLDVKRFLYNYIENRKRKDYCVILLTINIIL